MLFILETRNRMKMKFCTRNKGPGKNPKMVVISNLSCDSLLGSQI